MIKGNRLIVVILLLLAVVVRAGDITEQRAYEIASGFFSSGKQLRAPAKGSDAVLRLAHTSRGYYAFNRGTASGFVIVAADDAVTTPVLGYADAGAFNSDDMPANVRWWLGEYERELASASANVETEGRVSTTPPVYEEVAPMLTTAWDQGAPYNGMCPVYEGERCLTGCVATAMAQVMYYHKWPVSGTGGHSYDWSVDNVFQQTLSADFSKSVYDWDAMTDRYGGESSPEACAAVARLMYDLGVAVDMDYSPEGSAASISVTGSALIDYFGYDKSAMFCLRNFYDRQEWEQMVYSNLAASCPVMYGGSGNPGAHEFVCDGYRDGYFHINWGWGGAYDGYFLISVLDPADRGNDNGYCYDQDALLNLKVAEVGSDYEPLMYNTKDFDVTSKSVTRWENSTFTGGFYNYGLVETGVTLGVKVVDDSGNSVYVASSAHGNLPQLYGYKSFNIKMSAFPSADGLYLVYPAFLDYAKGQWHDIRTTLDSSMRYLVANVSGNNISFSNPEDAGIALGVREIVPEWTAYAGKTCRCKAVFTNTGAAGIQTVMLALLPAGGNNIAARSGLFSVYLDEGESTEAVCTMTMPAAAGDYELVAVTKDMMIVGGRFPVTVVEVPTGELALRMAKPLAVEMPDNVSADNVRITAEVACDGGFYDDNLYAYIYNIEGGSPCCRMDADLRFAAGDIRLVEFHGSFTNLEVGKRYFAKIGYVSDGSILFVPGDDNLNKAEFLVTSLTGIDDAVSARGETCATEVFTLFGVLVRKAQSADAALSGLAPGVYVVRSGGASRRVAVQ